MDFDYLERFMAGDIGVTLEVLALFRRQAEGWLVALQGEPDDWRALVHTIKGAARGVGANALGQACEQAEAAARPDLAPVRAQLAAAVADIAAYQAQTG